MKLNILPKSDQEMCTEREKTIIRTAVLNINALLAALLTGKGMVSNPIEDEPENLGYALFFEEELSQAKKEKLGERIEKQVSTFVLMSEISYEVEIIY